MRALKSLLVAVFLFGVLARLLGTDLYEWQVGNGLMMIAGLGRLLIYVRGSGPPGLISGGEPSSPLGLGEDGRAPVSVHGRRGMTPVERVISDE